MTTRELEFEIERFIQYNERAHTIPQLWQDHWIKWVHQIERHKLDLSKRKLLGETAMPGITDGIANIVNKGNDKPCWERWGDDGFDPLKNPSSFVRAGCSRFGACICDPDKRREILKELGHVENTDQ